jgi:hypothetical protein
MRSDQYATVTTLQTVAPAFVEMANRMVYATLSTVDRRGRPRSRMVHTLWEWDGRSRREGWERFKSEPPPLGYDPAIIPPWQEGPDSPAWGVLRLEPWHLRVFPGIYARSGGATGQILTWQEGEIV